MNPCLPNAQCDAASKKRSLFEIQEHLTALLKKSVGGNFIL